MSEQPKQKVKCEYKYERGETRLGADGRVEVVNPDASCPNDAMKNDNYCIIHREKMDKMIAEAARSAYRVAARELKTPAANPSNKNSDLTTATIAVFVIIFMIILGSLFSLCFANGQISKSREVLSACADKGQWGAGDLLIDCTLVRGEILWRSKQ